jgi:hypothetical protein
MSKTMKNHEKKAILLPGLLGAGIGAAASPEGHYGAGAVHGASRGVGLDVGAGVGGVAGGLAGLGIGAGLSNIVPEQYKGLAMLAPTAIGALGGGGLGGYGGYHAGAGIAKSITGKKAPWQQSAKKKKPASKKKPAADQEETAKAAALVANTAVALSDKAAAVKAAIGDPNRTWGEWWDGQENDLTTAIGVKKSPEYLAHDIRFLEANGRNEEAAKLRAALPKGYDASQSSNPYDRVSESRQGITPKPSAPAAPAAPNHYMNAGLGAAAGGAAGAMLGKKNRFRNAALGAALGGAGTYVGSHLAHGGNVQSMLQGLGLGNLMAKKSSEKKSALDFGKMLGDAGTYAKDLYNKVPEGITSGMGLGGVGGAALGGLAGLAAPGEEDEYDAAGNLVGRKQRSRLGAALRGVLGGGLAGAAAGGVAGHFAPEHTKSVMNNVGRSVGDVQQYGRGLYDRMFKPQLTSMPQTGTPGTQPQTMMA